MLNINTITSTPPHGNQPIIVAGNNKNPTQALILLHGRGASAQNILQITEQLSLTDKYLLIAPQADEYAWYPKRFIVDKKENQPYLDSALDKINSIVSFLETEFDIKSDQIVLAGFSQGACLVSEYIKQHPKKYKGVAVFSGGLIGNDTEIDESTNGSLEGTPIYMGCDESDFHIPKDRVEESAKILTKMGANVVMKIYTGLGHSIHHEGIDALQSFANSI